MVARAHGIRGELRVHLYNPASTALEVAGVVFVGDRAHEVLAARPVERAYLLRLAGVADRNAAESLRGQPVSVRREELALEEGEFLLADLVGCRVELVDGSDWGVVARIEPGPQDRLVIQQGTVERHLPVADPLLVDIDLDARRLVVDPPEGLPEEPIKTP